MRVMVPEVEEEGVWELEVLAEREGERVMLALVE